MNKYIVPLLFALLLLSTSLVSVSKQTKIEETLIGDRDKDIYPDREKNKFKDSILNQYNGNYKIEDNSEVQIPVKQLISDNALIISDNIDNYIWPQQGYNAQHLGRSPYSTENTIGIEKWRFPAGEDVFGSPAIGPNGTIYFGSFDGYLYAINPNGTLKWKFDAMGFVGDFYGLQLAVGNDGTIYFKIWYEDWIQAVNPDGTSKWNHHAESELETSITIGNDGIIYYGYNTGLEALYPNGTRKWIFHTGDHVQSTPAIDENGIIYFGCHDHFIRALYPNSTLKWSYETDGWVHGSPTIAPDGTIYCGSDDDFLYAFYPNGTLKWKSHIGSGMRSSPSQDKQGNLYFGVWHNKIMSVAPDGSIRWEFPIGEWWDSVWGSTVAISDDGSIYVGVQRAQQISCYKQGEIIALDPDGNKQGEIIALDLDGNLLWRKIISDSRCWSSPVIGEDGTVYICSRNSNYWPHAWGILHAFGPGDRKAVEFEYLEPGWLYIYGRKILPTPQGNTFIIGDCDVKVNVYSEDQLDCVRFLIDTECKYTDTEAPYEWKIDQRYSDKIIYPHRLAVRGYYKGGCEWTEDIFFWFIHL